MKNKLVKALFAAIAAAVLVVGAYAQGQMVKVMGTCTDANGQPIVGGHVELHNNDTNQTLKLNVDKKGKFLTIGAFPGDYTVVLYGADKQRIYAFNHVRVLSGQDNVIDFDMKKEAARGGATPEQIKKHNEEVEQQKKIGKLNDLLKEAAASRQNKDYQHAIDVMKPAAEGAPGIPQLWADLGQSYAGAKLYNEAIDSFQKAIALDASNGEYHNNLGSAYAHARDFENAMKEFEQAATLSPENASLYYYNEGVILVNSNQMDGALTAMDKSIAADPTKADAYYWKGMALLGKATLAKDGTMAAPAGTADAFNKYLALAPNGQWAEVAKASLQSIGAKVENSFGKQPSQRKKR